MCLQEYAQKRVLSEYRHNDDGSCDGCVESDLVVVFPGAMGPGFKIGESVKFKTFIYFRGSYVLIYKSCGCL